MNQCPACAHFSAPGASVCTECGVSLSENPSLLTRPVPEDELPLSQASPWSRIAEGYEDVHLPSGTTVLRIVVDRSQRQVLFPLPMGEIWLGRYDGPNGGSPDLDLAPDGGLAKGVSRQHAKILQLGNRLMVEDVGSANGTFLNDECIKPYLLYPLREGDVLQLGRLQLRVGFDQPG